MSTKIEICGPSPHCLFPRKESFVYFSGSHQNSRITLLCTTAASTHKMCLLFQHWYNNNWATTVRQSTISFFLLSSPALFFGWYMYKSVTIYMYIYLYIHMYIYTHIRVYICIFMYMYIYLYLYMHIHTYTYTYTYVNIYAYTNIRIHMHLYTHILIYIYTYVSVLGGRGIAICKILTFSMDNIRKPMKSSTQKNTSQIWLIWLIYTLSAILLLQMGWWSLHSGKCHTMQHVAMQHNAAHCNTSQHTATQCSTPLQSATHCNTVQHTLLKTHFTNCS